MKLSIIIAAYNEKRSILESVKRLEAVRLPHGFEKEIIIVDDGSTDGTGDIIDTLKGRHIILHHEENRGKGSAVRTGLARATGEYVVTQDADLENDPNDLSRMLEEMLSKDLTALYGSRRLKEESKKHGLFSFYAGGVFLSFLANALYGQHITDEPTCYKMFRTSFLKSLPLRAERFEYCPEVTALTSLRGVKIPEIAISYHPRSVGEGKKIRLKDGISATWTLISYRFGRAGRFGGPVAWIFAAALLARIALLLINIHAAGGNVDATIYGQDGYYDIAKNMHAGLGFTMDGIHPSPLHVPLFPLFIGSSLFLFKSAIPAALLQLLIGALLPLLAMKISLRLWPSRKLSLAVAWILALEPNFIFYSFIFFTETLFMALFFLFLLVFARYLETGKMRTLSVSAILLALSALIKTSAEFLPVLLVPLAVWLLRKKLHWKTLVIHAVTFIVIFVAVLSPWLYRNYAVFGRAGMTVLPTYNLYICLVPSVLATVHGTGFAAEQETFLKGKDILGGLDFKTEKKFRDEAVAIALEYPRATAEVTVINIFTFFTHDGMLTVLQNAGITPKVRFSHPALSYFLSSPVEFAKEASGFIFSPFILVLIFRLFWVGVTALFLFGCYALMRRKLVTPAIALAFVVVIYFAATTPSNGLTVNARFRMPVDPIILAIAGVGCMSLKDRRKAS